MYGWSGGLAAGFSPAPRTENPTYEYLGRMPVEGLVRTGDVSDKLRLPIGHEFTPIEDIPVPPIEFTASHTPPEKVPIVINSSGAFSNPPVKVLAVTDGGFGL